MRALGQRHRCAALERILAVLVGALHLEVDQLLAVLLALAGPAVALDDIVYSRGWTQVDYVQGGGCRAEVRGNGQFYRIAQAGMAPREVVFFQLENEDIKPVERRIVADSAGAWPLMNSRLASGL